MEESEHIDYGDATIAEDGGGRRIDSRTVIFTAKATNLNYYEGIINKLK